MDTYTSSDSNIRKEQTYEQPTAGQAMNANVAATGFHTERLLVWKKCVSAQKEKYCPKKSVQNSQGGGQFEMCKLVKYSNIEDKMK